jgi:hypothetical protein
VTPPDIRSDLRDVEHIARRAAHGRMPLSDTLPPHMP